MGCASFSHLHPASVPSASPFVNDGVESKSYFQSALNQRPLEPCQFFSVDAPSNQTASPG